MFKPPLPDAGEFGFEPPGHDVHGNATAGVVVDASDLFGCDSWVPWSWEKSGDDVQFLCGMQEGL